MIEELEELRNIILNQLVLLRCKIDRIKETENNQSIYIYTEKGVIRLSTHHNKLSFDKCIASLTVPVEKEFAIKMINNIYEKN